MNSMLRKLADLLPATQDNLHILKQVTDRYAVSITQAVRDTIRAPDDPVALQYVPQAAELVTTPEELADPIGDEPHSPVKGIIHRYPDRVLLLPVKVCAVYCRFCFRREQVGPGQKMLKPAELETALDYIRTHAEIYEVILSGGDPLILKPEALKTIVDALSAISHVQVIRIHTRMPVADPDRITAELCSALSTDKALYVAVHTNHVQELSARAEAAFGRLIAAGCTLVSQTVLLRGVNDSADTLDTLFRRLLALRVKPYYLHHPDLATGTSHFRLCLAEGQAIYRQLRGRLSGLALPQYVLDIPGGHGKVPVGICYAHTDENGQDYVTDSSGQLHAYPPVT